MRIEDLSTPALLVERGALERNLAAMAERWPGARLRPHVKAHKCTELARLQRAAGHPGFTCATPREALGMAAAGLGQDLLIANEVLDRRRLAAVAAAAPATIVAVDSEATVLAAAGAGITRVLVDVDVGLPRCGVRPDAAGALARLAGRHGLEVCGVMGYEGHLQALNDAADDDKAARTEAAMAPLLTAADDVRAAGGGPIISGGGTGTAGCNTWVTEMQAGSYALMDSAYAAAGAPFEQALTVLGTVISVSPRWAVADVGLKALGMDHGNPSLPGAEVLFCSDEHVTFTPIEMDVAPGEQVRIVPAHVDPTVAYHDTLWLVDEGEVLESWPVDLRGW